MMAPDVAIGAILVKIASRVDEGMRIMDPTYTKLSIILRENIPLAIGLHSHESLKTFALLSKTNIKMSCVNVEVFKH